MLCLVLSLDQYSKLNTLRTARVYLNRFGYYTVKYSIPLILFALSINISYYGLTSLNHQDVEFWWDTRKIIGSFFTFVNVDENNSDNNFEEIIDMMIYVIIVMYVRLIIFSVLISEIQYDMHKSINYKFLHDDLKLDIEEKKRMTFAYFLEVFFMDDWKPIEDNLSD